MITQKNFQPIEASSPRVVSISIQSNFIENILPFLITSHIPFTVSFGDESKLIGHSPTVPSPPKFQHLVPKNQRERELINTIYQKYCVDEIETIPPKSDIIANLYGLSPAKFKLLFKKYYGQPFYNLYVEQKMNLAAKLLKEGYKACEVSKKIGYTHPIKFSKMFQKYFQLTPKKFQQNVGDYPPIKD